MANVLTNKSCYGCGICARICPQKLIDIKLNQEGFYEPFLVNENQCTNCGLCSSVCSFNFELPAVEPECVHSFAAWSNDDSVRKKCSSGGVAFEIGRFLISSGYRICSVRYNTELDRAEHYIAYNVDELWQSVGSKYIQSYTLDALRSIDRNEKYLFVGTPCQVDSMRRYVKKLKIEDNFLFVDFFCHGVPSMLLWKKYVDSISKKIGHPTSVVWRNKSTGWHDSWEIRAENDNEKKVYFSKKSHGDSFYSLFLSNVCLNKACYSNCKYKFTSSAADIRLGDAWGYLYKNNESGVSIAIAFSEKGNSILKQTDCELIEHNLEEIAEDQLKNSISEPPARKFVMSMLEDRSKSIRNIQKSLFWYYRIDGIRKRIIRLFGIKR